jgi:hypothetical protein
VSAAAGVSAVVLNVTAVSPTQGGYLTVYPDGVTRPTASNLNFLPGQVIPNLVVAPVLADGTVDFYNGSPGTVQLVADVSGYFVSGTATAAGEFTSLTPARILDTRTSGGPIARISTDVLPVVGHGGVPAGATAVVLNLTVVSPTQGGYITAWADGSGSRPTASTLNFSAGEIVADLAVVPIGTDGDIDLYNGSGGTSQLVADVAGYYL